jgi:hypothetical protein
MPRRRIGEVTVTRVLELGATGGTRFILPAATPAACREIAWLAPHFADQSGRLVIGGPFASPLAGRDGDARRPAPRDPDLCVPRTWTP